MFNNIRGVIIFKGEGLEYENFINILRDKNIVCYDLTIIKGCIYGKIYKRDLKTIINVAEKNGISVSIVDKKGLVFKIIPYKRRYGVILGVCLSLFIITFLSNTIIKIEIQGIDKIPEEHVLSLLNDYDLSMGKFIPSLNYASIERNILVSDDRIAWIGIRNIGGRVVVEIDEMVDSPYIIPKNIPCNIIADRSAQIISAEIYSGKLVVNQGDAVTKGQLLVSGLNTDKRGKSVALHSYGKIIGQYEEKVTFTQNLTEEINVRTGNEIFKNQIQFFGLRIPLYLENETQNLECEYEENTSYLSFFSSKIPIGIVHEKYIPFQKITVDYTEDEALKLLDDKISTYEENLLNNKAIVSKEIQKNKNDETVSVTVLYILQGEIGTLQEIF